jgi:hypothetical protein
MSYRLATVPQLTHFYNYLGTDYAENIIPLFLLLAAA